MTRFDRLTLPAAIWDDIVAHSREEAPRECVGFVTGPAGQATATHRLANLYPDIDFYEPDPDAAWAVLEGAEARGEEVVAIYHSHPTDAAVPSARDIEHAGFDSAVFIICSLLDEAAPVLRGWWIVEGVVSEVVLVCEG